MTKKILISSVLLASFFLSSGLQAKVRFHLEDFTKSSNSFSAKYITTKIEDESLSFLNVGISPDFDLGPIGVGLDLNMYLPTQSDKPYPAEFNTIVLRRLKYDHMNQMGFEWGWLRDVTLGYGLVMNDFNTDTGTTAEFSNDKAGVLAYGTVAPVRIDALWTMQNVLGARATYSLEDSFALGAPINFGVTYITDSDGASPSDNTTTSRPEATAMAADIGIPLGGEFFTVFAEYGRLMLDGAELSDAPGGFSTGFQGSFFSQIDYGLEYRNLQAGFVPGYFDNTYELTSYDSSQFSTQTNGLLARFAADFMDYFRAGVEWESYEGHEPLLTAALGWRKVNMVTGVINYTVPYQGVGNALVEADVLYEPQGPLSYLYNYKRQYITTDTYTDSMSIGVRVNVANMFPFI